MLIGFFNSGMVNEWRTPNTVALRLLGRGDVFYAYVEYTTGKWRAGGDSPGGFATVKDEKTGRTNLLDLDSLEIRTARSTFRRLFTASCFLVFFVREFRLKLHALARQLTFHIAGEPQMDQRRRTPQFQPTVNAVRAEVKQFSAN